MADSNAGAPSAKDIPLVRQDSHTSTEPAPTSDNSESDMALKSAYRKMDIRLVAWYAVVYFFLKLESHNITNAAIMNIEEGTNIKHQLGNLTSEQWAMALSVPHYPYLLFEPISTFLLKRFSPRKWMSRIMLTWGIIAMCHGATQNFGGLLACRFLLGLAEAGFFPGVLYHLSFWYPASRMSLRISLFAAASAISGSFSGLLAFATSFLNHKAGLAGWRWMFIIEGIPAVVCGISTWIFLPNYPDDATFLTDEQRRSILNAIPDTQPSAQDKTWDWQQIFSVLKDPTTLTFFLIWACHAVGSKGVTTVLPTVLFSLDMTNTATTQLLTIPPYIVGACSLLLISWLIRARKLNCWIVSTCLEVFGCVCYIVLIAVQDPLVKYIFVILATTSSVGVVPILWPERIRAAHGTTSAALAIGLTSAGPLLHGIVGAQIYQDDFGPAYRVSYAVSVTLLTCVIVCILVTWFIIRRRDKRTAREEKEEGNESEKAHGEDSVI